MSEIGDGFSRFDGLKQSAYWARLSCCNTEPIDKYDIENYNQFLQDKITNPTAADIAMQDTIREHRSAYFEDAIALPNKNKLEKYPENDVLVKTIEQNYKENYPKTGKLRQILIENNRFCLNCVRPKMTNKFEKLIIKLKSFI